MTTTASLTFEGMSQQDIDTVVAAFAKADINSDGFIDESEIDTVLAEWFPGVSSEVLVSLRNVIMAKGDRNADGRLDLSEFLELMKSAGNDIGMEVEVTEYEDESVQQIVTQLSQEEIDMLRDTFIRLDRDGDGKAGREELMLGVEEVVGAQRFPSVWVYLDKIFDVADRDGDNKLSLTEFLDSFANGPGAVPQEVVMDSVSRIRVRLTDDEISALHESFHNIDKNHDGFIDREELTEALRDIITAKNPDMQESNLADIVAVVMSTADSDKDGKLSIAEFIRSFQEDQGVLPAAFIDGRGDEEEPQENGRRLTDEEINAIRAAFDAMDLNKDGYLDRAEVESALAESLTLQNLTNEQVRDTAALVMRFADYNEDGKVSLLEFIQSFEENAELMMVPVAAAYERIHRAQNELEALRRENAVVTVEHLYSVFQHLDKDQSGFLERNEIVGTIRKVIQTNIPEIADDENAVQQVIDAILAGADTDADGKLSLDEFILSYLNGTDVVPIDEVVDIISTLKRQLSEDEMAMVLESFKTMDANNDGFVSREELLSAFRDILSQSEGDLDEKLLNDITTLVMEKVDTDGDGRVSLKEFIASFERDDGVLPVVVPYKGVAKVEPGHMPNELAASPQQTSLEKPESPDGGIDPNAVNLPASAVMSPLNGPSPDLREQPPRPVSPVGAQLQNAKSDVALTTPAKQRQGTAPNSAGAKSPFANDVSGVSITDAQLYEQFKLYDKDNTGSLNRDEFKKVYLGFENYGLEPSEYEIDQLFAKYCGSDNTISYNEFAILMLHRSRM